ncbi:hypothetical protein CDIK_1701 [Cucumispora dikerogammari]|nr:hypothetical protein CDIK_1701 [Cucumispora dikerogammari]
MEITKTLLNTARLLNFHTLNTSQNNQHVRNDVENIELALFDQTTEHLTTFQDLPPSYESAMQTNPNVSFSSENPPSYNEAISSSFQVPYNQNSRLALSITNTERESSVTPASENSIISRISYSLHPLRTLCKPFKLLEKCFEECTTTLRKCNEAKMCFFLLLSLFVILCIWIVITYSQIFG